jgi:hypothetical protein
LDAKKDKGLIPDRHQSAAIIQEPPKVSDIQRFLLNAVFRYQHLRPEQRPQSPRKMKAAVG